MKKNIDLKELSMLESIAESIEDLDKDTLKDTLSYLLKLYIIDKEIKYDGNINDNASQKINNNIQTKAQTESSFSNLIDSIKSQYSFEELDLFTVESNKVYIKIDDKKVLLSKNTGSSINSFKKHEVKNEEGKAENPNIPPERFKNLEMD